MSFLNAGLYKRWALANDRCPTLNHYMHELRLVLAVEKSRCDINSFNSVKLTNLGHP